MITHSIARIQGLSVHKVGNSREGDGLYLTEAPVEIQDSKLDELLRQFFLSSFVTPEFFSFTFSNNDVSLNPLNRFVTEVFKDQTALHEQSRNMASLLFECSDHPNVKSGDLYVAYFDNVEVNKETFNAVGIFKVENKSAFLKLVEDGDVLALVQDKGINPEKLDKGCLILNSNSDNGYKICLVDRNSRGGETQYWRDDFLKLRPLADSYYFTQNYLTVTKNFVTQQLTEEFDVSKADQIDLLNKSVEYFKTADRFIEEDFVQSVFGSEEVVDSFKKFTQDSFEGMDAGLQADFDINNQAVKKQARVFKSVLKLDKNFHIYIHGNKELIEKGVDENGRKFYKIYYNEEN